MVKQQPSDKPQRTTRNWHKRPNARSSERNPHLASRGRPPKQRMGTNPFEIQKQFTQEFIEFGKQYLEWKLNDNYVWSNDFDRKNPQDFGKLPIEDPQHEQALSNVISNMCNMMEVQVGREFRQSCIDSYQLCKNGVSLQAAQDKMVQKVSKNDEYSYLRLCHEQIPKKVIKPETIPKFVESIVEMVYKIAQKEAEPEKQQK